MKTIAGLQLRADFIFSAAAGNGVIGVYVDTDKRRIVVILKDTLHFKDRAALVKRIRDLYRKDGVKIVFEDSPGYKG
jgi:hypothetical protein